MSKSNTLLLHRFKKIWQNLLWKESYVSMIHSMREICAHRVLSLGWTILCDLTPVVGLNLLLEKVSDSPNFSLEFFFPNSILLCSFTGLWSGFMNPPLQSLVNQYFSQTFELLFSKKNIKGKAPRGWRTVKFREFGGKVCWNKSCLFHEITGFTLTLLEKVPRTQNSEEKLQESGLFCRANLVLLPALNQLQPGLVKVWNFCTYGYFFQTFLHFILSIFWFHESCQQRIKHI